MPISAQSPFVSDFLFDQDGAIIDLAGFSVLRGSLKKMVFNFTPIPPTANANKSRPLMLYIKNLGAVKV
jgi:hypothetical protein